VVLDHSVGALLGFVIAVVLLKFKWVDCENWDLFAVMQGRQGKPETIIGTFQDDGKHFVFASSGDTGSGEATSDEMKYCWATSSPRFMGTGCATFKRNK